MKYKIHIIALALVLVFVAACADEEPEPVVENGLEDETIEEGDAEENGVEEREEDAAEEETEEEVDEADEVRQVEVEGFGRDFDPEVIEVEVGETIEFVFTNTGGTHDFVIPQLGVGTEIIGEGETDSFTYTFEEEGTFDFECSVANHAEEGMVGEIIVS